MNSIYLTSAAIDIITPVVLRKLTRWYPIPWTLISVSFKDGRCETRLYYQCRNYNMLILLTLNLFTATTTNNGGYVTTRWPLYNRNLLLLVFFTTSICKIFKIYFFIRLVNFSYVIFKILFSGISVWYGVVLMWSSVLPSR